MTNANLLCKTQYESMQCWKTGNRTVTIKKKKKAQVAILDILSAKITPYKHMICCDSKFTYMEQSCYRDCSSLTGLSIKTDNGDTSHGANKSGIYVTTTDCRQIKGKENQW